MADNLTHGLAGALLAQTGFQQRYGPAATVALVVGAELPDLDFLFALGGPVLSFVHHRGMTHSFLGGVGLALLGALVLGAVLVRHVVRRQSVSRYGLVSVLGIGVGLGIVLWRMSAALAGNPALHLLALQSGGVHLAGGAGVVGLGAWCGRRWHGSALTVVVGRWGGAAVAGYIGLCLVSQRGAQHLLARTLGPQLATVERLTALPLPGWGPVQWRE